MIINYFEFSPHASQTRSTRDTTVNQIQFPFSSHLKYRSECSQMNKKL